MAKSAEKKQATFEENIKRLEEIVNHLERGDMPLGMSLELFEEGTGLVKKCTAELDEAEQKVVRLRVSEAGKVTEEEFDKND